MRLLRALSPLFAATALVLPVVASGQHAPVSPATSPAAVRVRAALAPLAALVGQWEGEASATTGPGKRTIYQQYEDVVFGAGSTVLIVRGTGRSTEAANRGEIVFEAAATIWFDPDSSRLRMRAHRAEGIAIDAEVELKPDSLIWGFPVPGGRVRYTIAYSNTAWHEVGHFIRDGASPMLFIDMRLKRTKAAAVSPPGA